MQEDWVGGLPPAKPFKDIRNQRSKTAERKAVLNRQLGVLLNAIPSALKSGGSINAVRDWRACANKQMKVYRNSRSSVFELEQAINALRPHYSVEDLLRLSLEAEK